MIVNIPIEPIEQRYSADWYKWFNDELEQRKFNFKTVLSGRIDQGKIQDGAFLDVIGTTYFKAEQIADIAHMVKNGVIPRNERVVFLIHDGWFPVEQIAYMRDMLGCHEWKIVGIFHAGTYDSWDQTAQHGMATWGEDLENSWFKIYDKIVVASEYHSSLLCNTRRINRDRISVIPWKVEVPQDLVGTKKENWVIMPHRHNPEKLEAMFKEMRVSPYNWIDPNSMGEGLADAQVKGTVKRRYYELLAKSKICVSFSLQETFGIAMVEAVLLGCIPLVPDRLSYKEIYPRTFRYQGESEFKEKLECFCQKPDSVNFQLHHLQDKFKKNSAEFFDKLEDVIHNL